MPVGVGLDDFDVNQATHTVYVGFGNGAGGVAAFDARTCSAMALSGCGHIGRLIYPQAPFVPAVSVDNSNSTIYAAGATNTIARSMAANATQMIWQAAPLTSPVR